MVMEEKAKKLLILYASETGNAIDAAERLGREGERRGCPVSLLSIDDFDPSSLPEQEIVIFVVSTTGQGDNPDSIKVFWKFLLQRSLTQNWLSRVNYAVFGLGDSSYQKYNFVAKKLDKRLSDLGATAVVERGLGDDQHPSGYEGALDPWLSTLWKALYQRDPKLFPKGPELMTSNKSLMDQPKVQITYHDVAEGTLSIPDVKLLEMQIESTRFILPGKLSGKYRPDCFLKMVKNEPLSKAGCRKDVRHFEFEAVSSTVEYEVGDVVHILPGQDAAAVDAFIKRCNLDPESYIRVQPKDKENDQSYDLRNALKVPVRLKTFVELAMDVASASPRRYFFEVMSYFASAEHEKERLQYFASPEGRDDLYEYNQKERRTVLEVLEDFPSVQMPFEWKRTGLCSSWLAVLDPQKRVLIPAWFQKGSLPSPSPSLPLILVGPGTGCAPFRGFVEERALQSRSGSTAPILFFFGCRNEENDFLYRDFWLFHSQKGGVLSEEKGGGFFAAFSRDQQQKVYVQHKMREQSFKIWNLLTEGAAVYVAGSANKMPSDVLLAFEEIVSKEGGVPKEAAVRWLRALEKAGKYHVEAWS
ncbi:NADPH-dependent diflavin oxidoreductase 1 isoform X2 [Capsicum annuum]|uniref:NADPH-dependent diflavin oxidoreductase 1 isoform X2 n=1 Tax=Capsicum annuum TaxID=4072 RepID=UPI001FB0B682|nr:NADPH-dependent diflavin oxidoreductase 1 isoform X2 [Capsicum annuum]